MKPKMATKKSKDVMEGRMGLRIPSSLRQGRKVIRVKSKNHQNDDTKESKESRGRTVDGIVRPLALSFDTEMRSREFKGDFNGPTLDEGGNDGARGEMDISGEKGNRITFAAGVTDQNPANP